MRYCIGRRLFRSPYQRHFYEKVSPDTNLIQVYRETFAYLFPTTHMMRVPCASPLVRLSCQQPALGLVGVRDAELELNDGYESIERLL